MPSTFTDSSQLGDRVVGFLDSATGLPPGDITLRALSASWTTSAADPGRRYPAARLSRRMLDEARESVARALGVGADGIFFAPDRATAVWWTLTGWRMSHPRLVVSAVEDLDVMRATDVLTQSGVAADVIGVDRLGRIAAADLSTLGGPGTAPATVVVQAANLEIGTRQDLAAVRATTAGQVLVADLQAIVGREDPPTGWDAGFAEARMWGGPPGVTVVAVADPSRFRPEIARTDGHGGVEPSFPPVPLIAAAALALESADPASWRATADLSHRLREQVAAAIDDVVVVGDPEHRVGWLTMLSVLYVAADEMVDQLGRRGWAVASGASCTSDTRRPHHVLVAVGAPTHGSLRVSVNPATTNAQIDAFVADLSEVVRAGRAAAGATDL